MKPLRLTSLRWVSHIKQGTSLLPLVESGLLDCDYNQDYNSFVNEIVFSPAAMRQYKRLPAAARRLIRETVRERLSEQDPTEETRNRFRLRRISEHADYELRIDPWRVFYRVQDKTVTVDLIGQKKGNILLIEGKEFRL